MLRNTTIFSAQKTFELDHYVFNPIATINSSPNVYLIPREEYDVQEAINKFNKEGSRKPSKLIPKNFMLSDQDARFRRQNEEKSIIVTRVTSYQLHICNAIDEIWQMLMKPPLPNEYPDRHRQRKLFSEFIGRFSRNYVYELERIIDEIRLYQIDHYSYFERSTNHLVNKICNVFALIMRALQVYRKNLSNLGDEHPRKLAQFMELVISAINLCIETKIFAEEDLVIKMLKEKSDGFLSIISPYEEMPMENSLKKLSSLASTSRTKSIFVPTTARYTMYDSKSSKVKSSKSVANIWKTSKGYNDGVTSSYSNDDLSRSSENSYNIWQQDDDNFKAMCELEMRSTGILDFDAYKEPARESNDDLGIETTNNTQIENFGDAFASMNFDEVIQEPFI